MQQENKKTLIESIGEIQSNINIFVGKNARNEYNKYNYFTESDLYQTLKPQLKEHNITYTLYKRPESQPLLIMIKWLVITQKVY